MDPSPESPSAPQASPERILTASPYLFCELDRNGRIHRLNAVAEAQFGYSWEALNGTGILALVHPDERGTARDAIASAGPAPRAPVHLRCQSASGTYRRMEWEFSFDETSGRVLSWGRDISEAMAIREELVARIEILTGLLDTRTRQVGELLTAREDESRARRLPTPGSTPTEAPKSAASGGPRRTDRGLFERIPTGVLRVSSGQRILRMNPEMKQLLGGDDSAGSLIGSSFPGELLKSRAEFRRLQDRLAADGTARDMVAHLRRPDGRILRARVDGIRVAGDGRRDPFDELYVRPEFIGARLAARPEAAERRLAARSPRARLHNAGGPTSNPDRSRRSQESA